MITLITFFALLQLFVPLAISVSPAISTQQSIYEILRGHGLPMGLLPKGVNNFEINEAGRFQVHLDNPCNAKFESELHYERNVSGLLTYGHINELSGISAKELFLWFPVKEIHVDVPSSGLIFFDVGVVRKQFSLSLFETPKDCILSRDSESVDEIGDGKLLDETVSKSLMSKLRYWLDQRASSRNIL